MKTGLERGRFPSGLVSHLSDGSAELALKHLLQGLELVSGDVARLLQLLQQLDGSGNIWQEGGGEGRGQRSASAGTLTAELIQQHKSIVAHCWWSEPQRRNLQVFQRI